MIDDSIKIDELTPAKLREVRAAITSMKEVAPTVLCGLNNAQLRAIDKSYTPLDSGYRPHVALITPGNGVGKTQLLVQDIVGWTKGSAFLKSDHIQKLVDYLSLEEVSPGAPFPQHVLDFYDSLATQRDAGMLRLRMVCDSEDMKEQGSVIQTLKEWVPEVKFSGLDTQKCYRQIEIPHPSLPRVKAIISVKTFNQEVRKHSGSNCDRIWINEPMPQDIWGETAARTRSKKDEIEGSIMFCATVLNQAPYVSELIDKPMNVHCTGSLYENCVGKDVTKEMALEIEREIGVTLKENPAGGYITHGVLTKNSIDNIIADMDGTPEEIKCRKHGKLLHLEGRIFNILKEDLHRVKTDFLLSYPANYPVVQVVDPHPRHPDFSIWMIFTPSRVGVICEYPGVVSGQYFEQMNRRDETIEETCDSWRAIESRYGLTGRVVARTGDPNHFNEKNPRNNMTLIWDYAQHGFHFDVSMINDSIEIGHRELYRVINYDKAMLQADPNDPRALPALAIGEDCNNLWHSLTRYAWKEKRDMTASPSEQVDHKFKCPVDCLRYGVMWNRGKQFNEIKIDGVDDIQKIKQGRIPSRYRTSSEPCDMNLKGRSLINMGGRGKRIYG